MEIGHKNNENIIGRIAANHKTETEQLEDFNLRGQLFVISVEQVGPYDRTNAILSYWLCPLRHVQGGPRIGSNRAARRAGRRRIRCVTVKSLDTLKAEPIR